MRSHLSLDQLIEAMARTDRRERAGYLTPEQATDVRGHLLREIEMCRAEERSSEAEARHGLVVDGDGDRLGAWDLIWRMRSQNGPINWTVRRAVPAGAQVLSAAEARARLPRPDEPLPAWLRTLLSDEPSRHGIGALNEGVAEAVRDARRRRGDQKMVEREDRTA